jgi:pimeloyl-ACP methyl ester carboxylesterase
MLHGGPGVPDSMQTTIAPLLPEMRCISFDQRGVGSSVCRDGRYDVAAYLADIEAIREDRAVSSWHVLGHSWGGLLAQAYTARHGDRVRSLVLSSPSLGVGADWKLTKRVAFRTSRQRAGLWGTARFYWCGSGLAVPGSVRGWAMRHLMTETWHNYFLDPRQAPNPDEHWLRGCPADAMIRTDRAVSREDPALLSGLAHMPVPRWSCSASTTSSEHQPTSSGAASRRQPRSPSRIPGTFIGCRTKRVTGKRCATSTPRTGSPPPEYPAKPGGSPPARYDHRTDHVLHGSDDQTVPSAAAEVICQGIPASELHLIPGQGHFSNLEAPVVLNPLLAHALGVPDDLVPVR